VSPLQIIDCAQGTPEWHEARRGIITASQFACVLASGKGGGDSLTRRKYLLTLAGERVAGRVETDYLSNRFIDRGKTDENPALAEYEAITGSIVIPCGFMRRGDAGCSPDGLVGASGMVEAKTKNFDLHIDCLERDALPAVHVPQCQGALWISGREWLDFISYAKGLPTFIKRVYPDRAYHARLKVEVDAFNAELADLVERIRNYSPKRAAA
jgi:hypothetical protein